MSRPIAPALPTPTIVAEHIARTWALSQRADRAAASTCSPNATPKERAKASAVHDEAGRRVFLLWSMLSMSEPATTANAFVLAIRAHDLATDLASPGIADAKQTAEAMAELRQITGALATFLGRSAGATAAALGLGEWFAEASADWPRASALPSLNAAVCADMPADAGVTAA